MWPLRATTFHFGRSTDKGGIGRYTPKHRRARDTARRGASLGPAYPGKTIDTVEFARLGGQYVLPGQSVRAQRTTMRASVLTGVAGNRTHRAVAHAAAVSTGFGAGRGTGGEGSREPVTDGVAYATPTYSWRSSRRVCTRSTSRRGRMASSLIDSSWPWIRTRSRRV